MIEWFRRPGRRDGGSAPGTDELERYRAISHKSLDFRDIDGVKAPCIVMDAARFYQMLVWYRESGSRGASISTDLNILSDGLGHVFVNVRLTFKNDRSVNVMIDAAEHLWFFEEMAKATILTVASDESGEQTIVAVQLPAPEKMVDALDIIRGGLMRK